MKLREHLKPKKWLKILLCVILSLVIISGVIVAAAAIYINEKLNLIDYQEFDDEWPVSFSDGDMEIIMEDYLSSSDLIISQTDFELPTEDIHEDESVMNIMLMGTDERTDALSKTSRADSLILMSIDKKNETIRLISFERAIIVKMPNGKKEYLGYSFQRGGPKYVISCVQSHFNVDVDKYVRVNFDIFEKLVNAVGGVDITLTEKEAKAMNQEIRTNTYPLDRKVKSGLNHLNGFEALQYARLRYTDSDWVRIKRQRTVLKALQSQLKNLSLTEIDDAANEILPLIQTNLDREEIVDLLFDVPQMLNYSIEDITIPQKGTYTGVCSNVDYKKNSEIIEEFLYGE